MLNEGGYIEELRKDYVKSEMIKQLWQSDRIAADVWQEQVFEALNGQKLSEVDWQLLENKEGFFRWIRSFDHLIQELIEDGHVQLEDAHQGRLFSIVDPN